MTFFFKRNVKQFMLGPPGCAKTTLLHALFKKLKSVSEASVVFTLKVGGEVTMVSYFQSLQEKMSELI